MIGSVMLTYKISDLVVKSFGFYTISKKIFQNFQKIEPNRLVSIQFQKRFSKIFKKSNFGPL